MKIYGLMIEIVKRICGLSRKVQQHDPDLARQMRRAVTSVPLNAVEGWHSLGGNRVVRFHSAMGSARETLACLDVAVACGYLSEADVTEMRDHLDHVVAVMWRLSRARK
jgi:four helix bundle protein